MSVVHGYLYLKSQERAVALGYLQPDAVRTRYEKAKKNGDPTFDVWDEVNECRIHVATDDYGYVQDGP